MREVIRAVFKTGSGSSASMLLSAVSAKIMAVVSGPYGIGLYSLIQQLVQTISATGIVGSGRTVLTQGIASRTGSNRDEFIVTAFWILAAGALVSSLSLVVLAPWIAPLVFASGDGAHIGLVRWTALPVALTMFMVFLNGVLNGFFAIGRLAFIQVAGAGMSAAVSYPISSLANSGYLVAFVAMISLSITVQIIVGFSKAYRCGYLRPIVAHGFRIRVRRDLARSFLRVAGTLMATSIFASICLLFIRSLIVQHGGVEEAGIFNVAWVVCMVYPMIILNSFSTYYLPALSQASTKEERGSLMSNVFRLSTILIVPVLLLAIVLKPLMVSLLYSQDFYPSLSLLRWMLLGVYFRTASLVFTMPMLSFVDMKAHFWTYNLWYVGFVGFSIFAIVYSDSLEVIGIGFVIVYLVYLAYAIHYSRSRHQFSLERHSAITWIVGLALLIAASALTWSDTNVDMLTAVIFASMGLIYMISSVTKQERSKLTRLLYQTLTRNR